jgi:hypothetical protein
LKFEQGEPFVIGLAYWPGGTVAEWGPATNDTNGTPGLNPCFGDVMIDGAVTNYRNYLASKGVFFATYSATVDNMAALRLTRAEETALFDRAGSGPRVLSVIAFRADKRSEARYVRSASTSLTTGTGSVERLGLLATMEGGVLDHLEWYDFDGCDSCGGSKDDNC